MSATLKILYPVPPNTSLAKITEKAVATATIQRGVSMGTIIGISIPETRNPSATSSFFTCAMANSMPRPTT